VNKGRGQHEAFLAYQLGYCGAMSRIWAGHFWRTADRTDPVPMAVRAQFDGLVDVIRRLRPLARRCRRTSDQMAGVAEDAWLSLKSAWGKKRHAALIQMRDSDPDFCDWEALEHGWPLEDAAWNGLHQMVAELSTGLPRRLAAWTRLGGAVASVLDPRQGGEHAAGTVVLLENQLSEMMPDQPLLDGIALNLAGASIEQVTALHCELIRRLTTRCQSADQEITPSGLLLTKEAKAVAILVVAPKMPDSEIARLVECNRASLYRMKRFCLAKKALREGKQERPRGRRLRGRSGEPIVDAEDSPQ
jgi:hypothetical protein